MNLLELIHEKYIYQRRILVLSRHLIDLIPANTTVLDVGCGDGSLADRLMKIRRDINVTGVDVLVREKTYIPVVQFDGKTLPYRDLRFDVVLFIDVLHHTEEPELLLNEARRVARKVIIIKDHTLLGILAYRTLRFMDEIGNARYGVALPYNYWTLEKWEQTFQSLHLVVKDWRKRLRLYPWPLSLAFDRSLHFIARLESR